MHVLSCAVWQLFVGQPPFNGMQMGQVGFVGPLQPIGIMHISFAHTTCVEASTDVLLIADSVRCRPLLCAARDPARYASGILGAHRGLLVR